MNRLVKLSADNNPTEVVLALAVIIDVEMDFVFLLWIADKSELRVRIDVAESSAFSRIGDIQSVLDFEDFLSSTFKSVAVIIARHRDSDGEFLSSDDC